MPILQANIDAVATVNGVPLGGFQTITGGEVSAESVKDRPPGATFDEAVASLPSVGNITISRSWDEGRDAPLADRINQWVGWAPSSVSRVRRDKFQNQTGMENFYAILIRSTPPEGNTNAGGDKGMWELEFNVSGGPA